MTAASALPVSDWPESPYPGTWPDYSYVVHDGQVHQVRSADTASGWAVVADDHRVCVDDWLTERGQPRLDERRPVLSFGSNRCPSKVDRQGGPAVNLRAEVSHLAAVWAHGTRGDGQVPATLVGAEGHQDEFFVSMCTDADIALLNEIEGLGSGYDLVELDPSLAVLEDGSMPDHLAAYVGLAPHRWPVAGDDGQPVLLSAMTQAEIAELRSRGARHWEHDPDTVYRPL